jgi:hemoglobin
VTLFDQIGGEDSIDRAVDSFYDRMLDDESLAEWFAGVDLDQLKEHQRAFLAVGLGGPEAYDGRSMRVAHAGLDITDAAYTTSMSHLSGALSALGVEPSILGQILKRIELMRVAIVAAN